MKLLLSAVLAVVCWLANDSALAQEYPSRPVKVVVPFAPGGPNDSAVRPAAQKLSELLGQSFVIDYRAGANGVIGAEHVAKSAPDGHTLLVISTAFTINPSTTARLPYDTVKDFAAVSPLVSSDMVMVVNPVVPAKSVAEFVALAKARPGRLSYGSTGTGGSSHLCAELLKIVAGIDMTHIPYKGAAPAMVEVIGGHVDMAIVAVPPTLPQIQAGKVRAVAVASLKRASGLPKVPTFSEAGLPGIEVDSRYGLVAPAGTPTEIVQRLNATLLQILRAPEMKARYASFGLEPVFATPEQYTAQIRDDIAKWKKVAVAAKLSL